MNSQHKQMSNKVPELTMYFWIIKICGTTVGETLADYLNGVLHFGLTATSIAMSLLLLIVLFLQFKTNKYIPSIYWLAVVFISVVGTLITDNLTDKFEVPLETTTVIFSILLGITFAAWFALEKTLSIHSITTVRREAFYWLAILFTFALGTAAGDLIAEKFGLGYLTSLFIFTGIIALVTIVNYTFKISSVLTFWLAYILTRPLGASIGDYLSQAHIDGGLGWGATSTSAGFLFIIVGLIIYLTWTKK